MPSQDMTFALYTVSAGPFHKDDPLGKVLGHIDLHDLLVQFLQSQNLDPEDNEKAGELRMFAGCQSSNRRTQGFILNGSYGKRGLIIRRKVGKVFDKTVEDADMQRFYFSFYIPEFTNVGILVSQTLGKGGIAEVFQNDFVSYCKKKHPGIVIRLKRMAPSQYVSKIIGDGQVKSIRFVKYSAGSNLEAKLESKGMASQFGSVTIEIKPKSKQSFDLKHSLLKRLNGSKGDDELSGLWAFEEGPDKTLVTVSVGGRDRTLQIDTLSVGRPDVVQHMELSSHDGLPEFAVLEAFAGDITNDLIKDLET